MLKARESVSSKLLPTLALIMLTTWFIPFEISVKSRLKQAPPVMLWVWERPEDLKSFSNLQNLGVAFLAATVHVSGSHVNVHRRQQPVASAASRYLMPVVRIESSRIDPPKFATEQVDAVVAQILQIAAGPNWHGVQIDFDATKSERATYKELLTKLRKVLPADMPISITAIASWCAGDYWLANLPVDEVVPMYFDMGVSENAKVQYLATIGCRCHSAIGLSTSEFIPLKPDQYIGKRVYLFSRHPWQASSQEERIEITRILKYTEAS